MIIHKLHTTLLNHNKWEKKEIPTQISNVTKSGLLIATAILSRQWLIYIAPFCTKVHTKRSGMEHTVLPANNTMPAFPSWRSPDVTTTTNEAADIQLQLITHLSTRKDERLSCPSWLTYSGWLTHINEHPSATSRAQDSDSSSAKDQCFTAGPRSQPRSRAAVIIHCRLLNHVGATPVGKSCSFCCCRVHLWTVCLQPFSSSVISWVQLTAESWWWLLCGWETFGN